MRTIALTAGFCMVIATTSRIDVNGTMTCDRAAVKLPVVIEEKR